MEPRIGILGGTFDPIHLGHLAVADAASVVLELAQVVFIPSHHPPHRATEPRASGYHRFAMVALALLDRPGYIGSDVELQADNWSYTSVTLRRMHQSAFDALQLFFITGADAFAEIATWKDYPAILDLAHFVVVSRPGLPASAMADRLPSLRDRMVACSGKHGQDAATATDRARIWLLDAETPGVSSTDVRRRARAGEGLRGLLPDAVADYVTRNGLYR